MSGIEVVGLVLGAFPLLISAFEHYRDIAQVVGLIRNWEVENQKILNDVKDEQLTFRQNLVILLWPLLSHEVVIESDLEALLADPGGPSWREADVEHALEERLSAAFERYFSIMQELQSSLAKILQSLNFERPKFQAKIQALEASVPGKSMPLKSRFLIAANEQCLKRLKQVKFGLGRAGREEALAEIRQKNAKLEGLIRRSDKVTKLQCSATIAVSRRASKPLLQYWHHAGRIHALVQASWICSCKQKHCAYLWLHHPVAQANELKLLMLWEPQHSSPSDHAFWKPRDLEITWVHGGLFGPESMSATPVQKFIGPPKPENIRSGCSQKLAKRVKISKPVEPDAPLKTTASSTSASSGPDVVSSSSKDGQIKDLCKAMRSCGMSPVQLGALVGSSDDAQYLVCAKPDATVSAGDVSLEDILRDCKCQTIKRKSDRFKIALAVASAHLQLASTSWSRRQWEAKDIFFPQDRQNPDKISLDKPYVSTDFNDAPSSLRARSRQTDHSFECLGIILLELLFGKTLEAHELWQKLGLEGRKTDSLTRSMVASRWADDEAEGEAGPEFASAIQWCLRESPTTLNGNEWRKDLADRVVMPLQRCWDWIKPRTS
ncbi:Hypothetical predicted protein [Lecanosticta acicola]|uniref:DUF7580 domain-containing protein n=1 Tax=Lecanosticta acicola TaxID=111012 RepID=A0AAI9E7P1_9PEZI|nr:Hypothetical predicted protein [Lecanosticta acicola]